MLHAASLDIGTAIGLPGNTVSIKLTLNNPERYKIVSVAVEINYDPNFFTPLGADLGLSGAIAKKSVSHSDSSKNPYVVAVLGNGIEVIPAGTVASIVFKIKDSTPGGTYTLTNAPSAAGAGLLPSAIHVTGYEIPVNGDNGTITVIAFNQTTTTTPGGGGETTTTSPYVTTSTIPGGNTTTTVPNGSSTTSIPGNVTTSIVPPGEVGADFIASPLTGKMPLQVQFANFSGGDIATFLWVFGDGSVSTEKNPRHVYEKKGKYSVILTVIGTNNTKTATKTRDNYIDVKGKCPLAASLDSPSQIETLRAMRDTNLDNFSGMLISAVYYRNAAEMNQLLIEYPDLRSDLRRLISENMDIFEGLLKGDPVTVPATVMNDTFDYLYKVKAHGSIKFQNDIDFMLLGVQNGYFLNALGIIIQ